MVKSRRFCNFLQALLLPFLLFTAVFFEFLQSRQSLPVSHSSACSSAKAGYGLRRASRLGKILITRVSHFTYSN